MGLCSKSQLTYELGIMPSAVDGYIRRGMPTRSGGLLDRTEALLWLVKNAGPTQDLMWAAGATAARILRAEGLL